MVHVRQITHRARHGFPLAPLISDPQTLSPGKSGPDLISLTVFRSIATERRNIRYGTLPFSIFDLDQHKPKTKTPPPARCRQPFPPSDGRALPEVATRDTKSAESARSISTRSRWQQFYNLLPVLRSIDAP